MDIRAVRILIRLVDNDSSERQLSGIDRIRISCQDLECGTRLPCRVRCTVQCERSGLLTPSADDCLYFACILLNDDHGRLWLRRKGRRFCYDRVSLFRVCDLAAVIVDKDLTFFR